jgi:hypothetical protein
VSCYVLNVLFLLWLSSLPLISFPSPSPICVCVCVFLFGYVKLCMCVFGYVKLCLYRVQVYGHLGLCVFTRCVFDFDCACCQWCVRMSVCVTINKTVCDVLCVFPPLLLFLNLLLVVRHSACSQWDLDANLFVAPHLLTSNSVSDLTGLPDVDSHCGFMFLSSAMRWSQIPLGLAKLSRPSRCLQSCAMSSFPFGSILLGQTLVHSLECRCPAILYRDSLSHPHPTPLLSSSPFPRYVSVYVTAAPVPLVSQCCHNATSQRSSFISLHEVQCGCPDHKDSSFDSAIVVVMYLCVCVCNFECVCLCVRICTCVCCVLFRTFFSLFEL